MNPDESEKPRITGTTHALPFEKLSDRQFEALCHWLVCRENFERVEYLGEAGQDGGRDVVGWKNGRRVVFQCKRVKEFGPAKAKIEIDKLRRLPADEQPHELVFVVASAVSVTARDEMRAYWGDPDTCLFWVGAELDERVNRYPDVVDKFFQRDAERRSGFRHNLPLSIGTGLKGRETDVTAVAASLAAQSAAALVQPRALHGLGGVGKTRLAVEFAWQHRDRYHHAFFIGADTPEKLRAGLAGLAGADLLALGLEGRPEPEVEARVRGWLRAHTGWLLILDNVDTAAAQGAARELLGLGTGHVLVTSRLSHWPRGVEPHEVGVLEEEAAVALLLDGSPNRRQRETDEEDAALLARELGYLPLALELAAAYLDTQAIGFAEYRQDWEERRAKVLEWWDSAVTDYPLSVAMTWSHSFEEVGIDGRALLRLLAHLAAAPVPVGLIEEGVELLATATAILAGEEGEEESWVRGEDCSPRDALTRLRRYSLVRGDGDTVVVHRMVQEVVRGKVPEAVRAGWAVAAVRWVALFSPGDADDVQTWPVWDLLRPHVERVMMAAQKVGQEAETAALQSHLAALLYLKSLHREAEPLMRRALEIDETRFGPDHPDVARGLNNLAALLLATNRLGEAEPLMRRALLIDETTFGPDHPNVAIRLNNLAQLLQATHRPGEAEPLMRRALAIDVASFGQDHQKVALRLNNLAALLQATNRLAEAEPLMRRALQIDETNFGPQRPVVARDLNNLAVLLQATNRLVEAEPLMRRALSIDETSFGQDHPEVATDLNNLAQLLQATNRLAEAEPLMRRALAIDEASFGPDHPNVANRLNNLALLFQDTNRLAEAGPLMQRSLAILSDFTGNTGHEHPHLRAVTGNYAGLLRAMGQSEEEIAAAVRAILAR